MDKFEVLEVVNRVREEKELSPLGRDSTIEPLPGGSEREFYRIIGEETCIAMFGGSKEDFFDYVEIQEFLEKKGLGVPRIFYTDESKQLIVMEDVGSESLFHRMSALEQTGEIENLYVTVLDTLCHLHVKGSEGIENCRPVHNRSFDYAVLRWESDYFREEFLESFCGFSPEDTKTLNDDFDILARSLEQEPRFFMHRDFQSQNIFFKNDEVRLIDFQTAHAGILTYDVAALLRDSYVSIPKEMRERLLQYYYTTIRKYIDIYSEYRVFREVYTKAAIQRNMQALGAFSFLSKKKKKEWFRNAIPQGFEYLKEGLTEVDDLSEIKRIVESQKVQECVKSIH